MAPSLHPVSPLDKAPSGHHYDPYTRQWEVNLTEAEVQQLWPYATKDKLEENTSMIPYREANKPPTAIAPVMRTEDAFELHDAMYEMPHMNENGELLWMPPAEPDEKTKSDNVVLPHHYARFKIEPVRFICENGLNFFQANIIKYILRWDAKNGLEDLRKARRYLDMFIKFVEGDPDWWRAA